MKRAAVDAAFLRDDTLPLPGRAPPMRECLLPAAACLLRRASIEAEMSSSLEWGWGCNPISISFFLFAVEGETDKSPFPPNSQHTVPSPPLGTVCSSSLFDPVNLSIHF